MSDPRLLILETSGRTGAVGLAQGARLVAQCSLDENQKHARDLAPCVAEMLEHQGWRARELQGVIVSLGPGSYTGLRVGVTSAKTLAYAVGAKLIGIETLAAVAAQSPIEASSVDVVADAQQRKLYVQTFRQTATPGTWESASDLAIRALDEWLSERDPSAWVSGPGIDKYLSELPSTLKVLQEDCRLPRLESLLSLGLCKHKEGCFDDVWRLDPIYLRPSAAEEQWNRRQSNDR